MAWERQTRDPTAPSASVCPGSTRFREACRARPQPAKPTASASRRTGTSRRAPRRSPGARDSRARRWPTPSAPGRRAGGRVTRACVSDGADASSVGIDAHRHARLHRDDRRDRAASRASNVSMPTLAADDRGRGAERHAELPFEPGRRPVVDQDRRHDRIDADLDRFDVVARRIRARRRRSSSASSVGCVPAHDGYSLTVMPVSRISQRAPRSAVDVVERRPLAVHRREKSLRPVDRRARSRSCRPAPAAPRATPLRAASPACSGFTIVPKFSLRPDASDAAIASAWPAAAASRPSSRDAAAAAPIVPSVDVQCQPRW